MLADSSTTSSNSIFADAGVIAAFLVVCAFIQITLGNRVLYNFLWLVLLGQVLVNYQRLETNLRGFLT